MKSIIVKPSEINLIIDALERQATICRYMGYPEDAAPLDSLCKELLKRVWARK